MRRSVCLQAATLLMVALPGCAGQSTRGSQQASPAATLAATSHSAAELGLNIVAIDVPGTHEPGRIRCPMWEDRRDEVELVQERLSLTGDQADQLKQQWTAFSERKTTAVPTALRQVPGAPTAPPMPRPPFYPAYGGTNFGWGPGCAVVLQITNTGAATVLVSNRGSV